MRRREFVALLSSGWWLSATSLWAEHHTLSADPLMVECDLASVTGRYTPTEDFYIRNHDDPPPEGRPQTIQITGLAEKALSLAGDDLRQFPTRSLGAVLECAGNAMDSGAVSNGLWDGVPLAEIFFRARPRAGATFVNFHGVDRFARSVPLDRAMQVGMLATRLNGQPLGRLHGYPWRVLMPGWYGMDSVKWVEKIEFASTPLANPEGTYQQIVRQPCDDVARGPLAHVQVKSVITSPKQNAVLRRGTVKVRGLAWSGAGKIVKVQASRDDGGTWHSAEFEPGTCYEWTRWQWVIRCDEPGVVGLTCRAADESGNAQPERTDPARLDGYANNWYHRVRCVVV